jgi:hypothetical protein
MSVDAIFSEAACLATCTRKSSVNNILFKLFGEDISFIVWVMQSDIAQ